MQRTHLVFTLFFALFLAGSLTEAESVPKFVKKEEKIREEMVTISRELGVTCTECHNVQNFTDDSKKSFKVGKEHMKLTQMLKENGFDGKKGPAATCYMCHRGKLMPDYKEPLSAQAH
jgi:nitrate/TMAO reductase-like tetraheme cytochrome c subunit